VFSAGSEDHWAIRIGAQLIIINKLAMNITYVLFIFLCLLKEKYRYALSSNFLFIYFLYDLEIYFLVQVSTSDREKSRDYKKKEFGTIKNITTLIKNTTGCAIYCSAISIHSFSLRSLGVEVTRKKTLYLVVSIIGIDRC
jgi:hypothetical protein